MLPDRHPIVYRFLRLGFRLFVRPLLPRLKRYYEAYKAIMPDGAYNAFANSNNNFCLVEHPIKNNPLISVVVPIYNPRHVHLLEMVYSVVNQHYENWELILVNASTNKKSRAQVTECSSIDTRIRVVSIEKNLGISENTNAGIKVATGDYIAFLDHDDVLHPCALHSVVETLQKAKVPDLIYTDEDKITEKGDRFFGPHCKPDWSPDLLRNVNYINHLTVIRSEMVKKVGGLRTICNGAQDYDLLLRVIDKCGPAIKHVPRILYHWRSTEGSTAKNINTKDYVFKAGTKALRDHIKRNNILAKPSHISGKPGFYELVYEPSDFSIIIGQVSISKEQACAKWIDKLLDQPREKEISVELIIGEWYKKFAKEYPNLPIKYVTDGVKNYWQSAVELAAYPVCVCFKIAAVPTIRYGLSRLAAVARDSKHTAVSPVVISENETILDAGVVGSDSLPKKLFEGYRLGRYTYFGNTDWVRNVNDLTTNIIAIDTSRLKHFMNNEVRSYQQAATLHGLLPATAADGSRLVVWAHTPFEYKGLLRPDIGNSYHNSQLFKLTPVVTMHMDNWGEGYAREPEK